MALAGRVLLAEVAVVVFREIDAAQRLEHGQDASVAGVDGGRAGLQVEVVRRGVGKLRVAGQVPVHRAGVEAVGGEEGAGGVVEQVVVEERLVGLVQNRVQIPAVERRREVGGEDVVHELDAGAAAIVKGGPDLGGLAAVAVSALEAARVVDDGVVGDQQVDVSAHSAILGADGAAAAAGGVVVDQVLDDGDGVAIDHVDGTAAAGVRDVVPDDIAFNQRASAPDRDARAAIAATVALLARGVLLDRIPEDDRGRPVRSGGAGGVQIARDINAACVQDEALLRIERRRDGVALDERRGSTGRDVLAVVLGDEVVQQRRGAAVDLDAASLILILLRCTAAVGDGEIRQHGRARFSALEGDGRSLAAAVEDRLRRAVGACDGDALALEVDVLVVGSGGDEDGVAGGCGVDAGLDGRLVGGNMDRLLRTGLGLCCEKQKQDRNDSRGGEAEPGHGGIFFCEVVVGFQHSLNVRLWNWPGRIIPPRVASLDKTPPRDTLFIARDAG
jgi:hypothetical protein